MPPTVQSRRAARPTRMKALGPGYVDEVVTTVSEVMTPLPPAVTTGDTVQQVARRMQEQALAAVPVCDVEGRLVGIVTERDIVRRSVAAGHDPTTTRVSDVMAEPVPCVELDETPEAALRLMIEHAVRRLPVTDRGRLVGSVSQSALVDVLAASTVRRLIASIARG